MFFRRERPKDLTFDQRLDSVRSAGFAIEAQPGGRFEITRDGCGAVLENTAGRAPRAIERPGILVGNEIASLVDAGFQKFFQTPSGKRKPALASELKALHGFTEDLREALGLVSLYNESLGTVSKFYLYDRLENRDAGVPKRVWES